MKNKLKFKVGPDGGVSPGSPLKSNTYLARDMTPQQQLQQQLKQHILMQTPLPMPQMLALVTHLRQLRTCVPPCPDDQFAPFFDTQKARMHTAVSSANSWLECLRMAIVVRKEIRRLEAQWHHWQQTDFASTLPKDVANVQLKAHVFARMIHAIGDRLNLLASDPAVQAAARIQQPGGPPLQNPAAPGLRASATGPTQQDAKFGDQGSRGLGSIPQLPLEDSVPGAGPGHTQQLLDEEELVKELMEKLSLC